MLHHDARLGFELLVFFILRLGLLHRLREGIDSVCCFVARRFNEFILHRLVLGQGHEGGCLHLEKRRFPFCKFRARYCS